MPIHEVFAATTASLTISPIMALIDMSILKSQLQKEPFHTSLSKNITFYATHKPAFRKPFGIMFGVYGATYSTANLTELVCRTNNIDYKLPTLLATSLVNITAINAKDTMYSKMLHTSTTKYPLQSKLLFSLRDVFTMMANFIVKKDVVHSLTNYMSYNKAEIVASLFVPTIVQTISTPIHILAVDKYQNPARTVNERLQNIKINYKNVLTGRIIRTIPAFCIGGFINDMLRPMR